MLSKFAECFLWPPSMEISVVLKEDKILNSGSSDCYLTLTLSRAPSRHQGFGWVSLFISVRYCTRRMGRDLPL